MIKFVNTPDSVPYTKFRECYNKAWAKNQKNIEAISIASYSKSKKEISSRFVNLKIIKDSKFIFFTNYHSNKSNDFNDHNQIAVNIFWSSINTQIRMKAKIAKLPSKDSDDYFSKRNTKKNALAISSNQSSIIDSYNTVLDKYYHVLNKIDLKKRPEYWGGYFFVPYEIEFWEGNENRLNIRKLYIHESDSWKNYILEP